MSPDEEPGGVSVVDVECALDRKLTLGQFCKLANLIESGAEAKDVIAGGLVEVNGEIEIRRGRGMANGDVVLFEGLGARVVDGNRLGEQGAS